MKIEDVYNDQCTLCDIGKAKAQSQQGHVCFVGTGRLEGAKLMIVADAPSFEEDNARFAQSFSDDRGNVVKSALKAANIKVMDTGIVFATYAMKCCPRGKVELAPMKTCIKRYLLQEIEIVKPKVIVLMGKTVQQAVLGMVQPLTKTHGKVFNLEGVDAKFVVVEHPFTIITSPTKFKAWVADFRRVRSLLNDEDPFFCPDKLSRYDFRILDTEEDLKNYVDLVLENYPGNLIAYDVETSGLDSEVYSPDYKVYSIQLGLVNLFDKSANDGDPVFFIPVMSSQFPCTQRRGWQSFVRKQLTRLLGPDSPMLPVAHNAKFDQKVLWKFGVPVFTAWDTIILWANTHGEAPLSLKEIAYQVSDLGGYGAEMQEYFKDSENFDAPPEVLVPYACLDIVVTRHLMYEMYNTILQEKEKAV